MDGMHGGKDLSGNLELIGRRGPDKRRRNRKPGDGQVLPGRAGTTETGRHCLSGGRRDSRAVHGCAIVSKRCRLRHFWQSRPDVPSARRLQRYFFGIFTPEQTVELAPGNETRQSLRAAINGRIIGKEALFGNFERESSKPARRKTGDAQAGRCGFV
jgi:hypothetical protein